MPGTKPCSSAVGKHTPVTTAIEPSRVQNSLMPSIVTHPDTRERPAHSRVPKERRCKGAGTRCSLAPRCCACSCRRVAMCRPALCSPRTLTHGHCTCTCTRRNARRTLLQAGNRVILIAGTGDTTGREQGNFNSGNRGHDWKGTRKF